eukprot:14699144-Alexandrium_andersonii.AAC.1
MKALEAAAGQHRSGGEQAVHWVTFCIVVLPDGAVSDDEWRGALTHTHTHTRFALLIMDTLVRLQARLLAMSQE